MKRYCFWWSTTDHIAWPTANWTWAECELVSDICATWGTEGVWWGIEDLEWSLCSGSIPPIPPVPGFTASLQPPGVDATTLIQPWLIEPWNPYRASDSASLAKQSKRKRLIKLICKCRGHIYEEEKEIENFEISVDDIKMVVKNVSGVELEINENNRNI